MPYDRTKTEAAALGLIDENVVVVCGPLEVPYLAFRKTELTRMSETAGDADKFMDALFEMINYRFKGTLPREDFDEFVSVEHVSAYIIGNRSGQKKVLDQGNSSTTEPS